jgi:polar amino acid transport system substrate-binding protein
VYDAKPFTAIELTAVLSPSAIAIADHYYNLMREKIPNGFYTREGIACMVPENNSAFLDRVNYAIVKLMEGYVVGDTKSVEIIDRGFGQNGVITIDHDLLKNYFQDVINSRQQIKLN